MLDKTQQERILLEEQIQTLKESIQTEIKERQELEARLQHLQSPAGRGGEVDEVYMKTYYLPKLSPFDKMLLKINSLKEKLDTSSSTNKA